MKTALSLARIYVELTLCFLQANPRRFVFLFFLFSARQLGRGSPRQRARQVALPQSVARAADGGAVHCRRRGEYGRTDSSAGSADVRRARRKPGGGPRLRCEGSSQQYDGHVT